jgi:hypothetical protein
MYEIKKSSNRKFIKLLKKAGKDAAEKAIRESKALGLSITYAENGKIIREEASGKNKIIRFFKY